MRNILPLLIFTLFTSTTTAATEQMESGRIASFNANQMDIVLNGELYRLSPALAVHLGKTKLYGAEAMQHLVEGSEIHFTAKPVDQQKHVGEIREIWIFPR